MSGRNRGGRNTTGEKSSGEITPELKKKIDNVEKVAPGWSKEDIIRLLERVNFNDQIAINDILDGVARPPQEWNEVVSKKTKAETKSKNQPQQQRGYRDGNRNQRSNTAPTQRFNRRDGEEGGERSDKGGERRNDRGERNNDRGDRNDRRGPRNNRQNRDNSETGSTSTDAGAQANPQNTNVPSQVPVTSDVPSIVTLPTQTTTPVSTVPTSQVPITGYKSQPQQSWASKAQSSMTPPVQRPTQTTASAPKHTDTQSTSTLTKPTHTPTTSTIPTINPPIVPLMPVSPITPIHTNTTTDTTHPEPIAKPNTIPATTATSQTVTATTTAPVGTNTRSSTYQPHKHNNNNNWRNKEARNQDTALEPVPSTAAIAAPTRTAPVTTPVVTPVTTAVPPTAAAAGNAHASFVASVTQPAVRLPSNLAAMGSALYDNEVQFGTVQVPASMAYNKKVTTPVTAPTTTQTHTTTTTTTTQIPHSNTHLAPSAPHLNEGSEDGYGQSEESYPKMEEHIMHNPQFSYAGHHGYPMFPGAYFPPETEGRMPGMYEQFYGTATHDSASDSKYPATTPGFSSFPRDSVKFTGETSPQGQTNPAYYGSPMYYPHYPNAFQQFGNPSAYYRAPYFPQGNYRGYPGGPYSQTPPGYPDELSGAFPEKGGYNPQTFDNSPSAAPSQQGGSQKLQSMPTSSKTYGGQQGGVENRDGGHVKNPMAPYNYNYLQSYPNANYSYPQGTGTYPSARQGSSNF